MLSIWFLGRTFLWSQYFSFRPFAGIRGASLKLDWDISFTAPVQPAAAFPQSFTLQISIITLMRVVLSAGSNPNGTSSGDSGSFLMPQLPDLWRVFREDEAGVFLHRFSCATPLEQKLTARNSFHTVKGIFEIAVGLKWEGTSPKIVGSCFALDMIFSTGLPHAKDHRSNYPGSRGSRGFEFSGIAVGARVDI